MALLRSFGLRHMHSVPSGLWGYVRDDTHLAGWETGTITPLLTMSLRMCLIHSQFSMGTFLFGVLDRGNGRAGPDGVCPRHVAYSTE